MRYRETGRYLMAAFLAACVICTSTGPVVRAADTDVTPSKEEYSAAFRTADVFMGNATAVDLKSGGEIYLTYTVEKVREDNESMQNGILGTDQPDLEFPYEQGGVLEASNDGGLLKEGYTYFFKFYYNDEGFQYVAAVSDETGNQSRYIIFESSTANSPTFPFTDDVTHAGVWFGSKVSAKFTNVRCYDQNGKDLGVYARKHRESLLDDATVMSKDTEVDHRYNIKVEHGSLVALSNKIPTQATTVYMEYTVKSCKTKVAQNGVVSTKSPEAWWPWEKGMALLETVDPMGPGYMLQTGASYIVRFERRNQYFMALVQRTMNGKTEFHEFTQSAGEYASDAPYFSLWYGEGADADANFELVDFKCYDAQKNNLSVQANCAITVEHFGELEDYSGCEAMYYCKSTKDIIALYADKTAKVTRDGETEKITYKVKENNLTLQFQDKKESYDYYYLKFTDEKGRLFERLGTYYLNFETGTDEAIAKQKIDGACGYVAQKPEEPKKEGAKFLGWYLEDGTEYTFDGIVCESETLYAKWSDENKYVAVEALSQVLSPKLIGIAVSVLILLVGAGIGIVMMRRRTK